MYLLDTNTCVYYMKNAYPSLTQKFLAANPKDLFISSVTVFELYYGAQKSKWGDRNRRNLALFLAPFTILPFDTDDAMTAARIRCHLERQGTPIGPYDLQIASQALARGLTVLTHNAGEFRRVPDLMVEDWVE